MGVLPLLGADGIAAARATGITQNFRWWYVYQLRSPAGDCWDGAREARQIWGLRWGLPLAIYLFPRSVGQMSQSLEAAKKARAAKSQQAFPLASRP